MRVQTWIVYTLKTLWLNLIRKGFTEPKIHSGSTMNNEAEISQLDAEYDPELVQSDPIICQVCRKLTQIPGHI